ncbi:MAG: phosphocholine cytidylyltransferase family protein [Proteobacteria bacterium]|nr:phosphocholine cytidylyltransferase family protein [Pseudomonadota bacterium]NOG59081.1 phosphocholine cytidylyltransferase family protein [Pseudomonadota bacterium]
MKAIILAAGKGSRLYPITLNKPKGLLKIGNESILDRLVRQFKAVGINDVLLVVGYQKECLIKHFGKSVRYSEYKNFANTNNLHTLWSVKEELNDDVVITFADLIVHQSIIDDLVESRNDITMVVDTSQVLEGTMRVAVNDTGITSITTTTVDEASGNFIGISKFSKAGCELLIDEMSSMIDGHHNDYYTIAVDQLARKGTLVGYCNASEHIWREIDTKDEYDEAKDIYG